MTPELNKQIIKVQAEANNYAHQAECQQVQDSLKNYILKGHTLGDAYYTLVTFCRRHYNLETRYGDTLLDAYRQLNNLEEAVVLKRVAIWYQKERKTKDDNF